MYLGYRICWERDRHHMDSARMAAPAISLLDVIARETTTALEVLRAECEVREATYVPKIVPKVMS
jgi:hypothetical protein